VHSGLHEFQVTKDKVLESVPTQEVTHGATSAFVTAFLKWNHQEGWNIICQIKELMLYCHIHVVAFNVMVPHLRWLCDDALEEYTASVFRV
jgi:hypothetical protein